MLYVVRFVLFCADAVSDFLDKNCPYIAGAISFYTLFSLFPLLLSIISVAGFVLGPTAEREYLARSISEVIPVSAGFISSTMQGVVRARAITGIASVIGLLWTSTAAFGAMRKGINAAWGSKKTRPFLKERLIDFSLTVSAGLFIIFLLFVTPAVGFFREITRVVWEDAVFARVFWNLLVNLISPLISFMVFLALYRFLPNTRVGLGDVWLGALLASIAFDGAKWGFVAYVRAFPLYNLFYGSVGAIMALLTWVYVSAIILLFGALLTSRYAQYAARARARKEKQGLKLLWAGLSRVRLRDVASTEAG